MRKWIAVPATLLVFGCAGEPADPPVADAAPRMEAVAASLALSPQEARGQELYDALCWTCHGRAGRGDGPAASMDDGPAPPNFQTDGYASTTPADLQARVARAMEGDDPSHPHMQRVAPVLDRDRFLESLAFVPRLAYPAAIPGSALVGRETFMERCAGCHGTNGDGSGSIAYGLLVPAADLTTDPIVASGDFKAVFELIRAGGNESVHGSSMPLWGAIFDNGTIWDLVAYVATLQPEVLGEAT